MTLLRPTDKDPTLAAMRPETPPRSPGPTAESLRLLGHSSLWAPLWWASTRLQPLVGRRRQQPGRLRVGQPGAHRTFPSRPPAHGSHFLAVPWPARATPSSSPTEEPSEAPSAEAHLPRPHWFPATTSDLGSGRPSQPFPDATPTLAPASPQFPEATHLLPGGFWALLAREMALVTLVTSGPPFDKHHSGPDGPQGPQV